MYKSGITDESALEEMVPALGRNHFRFTVEDNKPYQKLIYIQNCLKSVDALPHVFSRSPCRFLLTVSDLV